MAVNLNDLPQLEGWVNITEAAEIIGISRQYAYRMAARTNDGLSGGWETIRQVGTKPSYVVALDEVLARKRLAEAGGNVSGEIEIERSEPESFHPSRRLVNAHSWWIAAELVSRHPHLMILETHPGGGSYDCLSIRDGRDPKNTPTLADLNRAGSIHLFAHNQEGEHRLTWADALSTEQPHEVIHYIERVLDLQPDPEVQATPRSLAYSLIATILTQNLNGPDLFDARNEFLDSSGDDTGWSEDDDLRGFIHRFPSLIHTGDSGAAAPIERTPRLDTWREPYDHFWAILRDERPILMVSVEGVVYTRQRSVQLSESAIDLVGGLPALVTRLMDFARAEYLESECQWQEAPR